MLRSPLIASIAIIVAGAAALAHGSPAPPHGAPGLPQEAGQAIFQGKGNCFTCHRQDAKGTPLAPDLTDDEWINFDKRPTQEEVETLIKEGVAQPKQHPAPMPPMGGASLTDEEITQVARYVLSLSEEE